MKILISNDDGIESKGLKAVARALSDAGHEVWVVAPEGQRSGVSHAITLHKPLRLREVGARELSCSGTPADCIIVALRGVLDFRPDLVVSGINQGPNIGTDVLYSGTAAAARQGALLGIPSLAASVEAMAEPFYFEPLAQWISDHAEEFVARWRPDYFWNINAPSSASHPGALWGTKLARRHYLDSLVEFSAPDGSRYCFVKGKLAEPGEMPGTDWEAVMKGYIAVSEVFIHPGM